MARISIIVAFACKKLAASGIIRQRNIGRPSLTSSVLLVGRGAIAAPLPEMAGVGLLTLVAKGAATLLHSDELPSAFLELEAMLL
jgi:hypothetical protein